VYQIGFIDVDMNLINTFYSNNTYEKYFFKVL